MEFKEAMRIINKICEGKEICEGCVLEGNCIVIKVCDIERAEATLAKWAAEHPEKTIADDFFEKHPKAAKKDNGTPMVCANYCGYGTPEYCGAELVDACSRCWRRPLEEVEG